VKKSNGINLVEYYDQESPYATEFRRLLHNINGNSSGRQSKKILVTSAMLAEGKSTVVSFLALTAARQKKRKTLIVDCDLRRPTLHKMFAVPRDNGLSEALEENKKAVDIVKKTAEPNLDIVTAGRAIAHPSDLFTLGTIGSFLNEAGLFYDLVLVDTAPLLPVSDPMLLAPEVDGVILVIKAGSTQREVAKRASRLLQNGQTNLIGIVLNNISSTLPYHYNESYYGYEYRSQTEK